MDLVSGIVVIIVLALVVGAVWSVASRRRDPRRSSPAAAPAPGQRHDNAEDPPWTQP